MIEIHFATIKESSLQYKTFKKIYFQGNDAHQATS